MLAKKENKEIERAINTLDFISEDPKERERHNSIVMSEYNRLTSQHNFYKAGLKDGIEKRNRSTEKKNGITKGEKNKSTEIAKKMLNMGFTLEQILEATNLSKEEIEKLK